MHRTGLLALLLPLACAAADGSAPTSRWTHPLAGVLRGDQGTIEITVRPDRPQGEFGNDWDFIVQIVPGRSLGKGANTLLSLCVPPAPRSGLAALVRTGRGVVRAANAEFAFVRGRPVNLALTWGRELALWADGRPLASTPMAEVPDEDLWPALMSFERFAPFDPQGLRISSVARTAAELDGDPATPFAADADTTLVAGPGFSAAAAATSRWQRESGQAVAKPAWLPEEQCLEPDQPAAFPLVVANHGATARSAELALALRAQDGSAPVQVRHTVAIPAGTLARLERPALPALASGHWTVDWRITGDGIPALSGASAIAVYPARGDLADGALAGFYGCHRPERWPAAPFARMGARTSRTWEYGRVFLWHRIEPLPGAFRWEQADEYVDSCLAGGLEPLAVLGYPSRWAALEPSAAHQARHEVAPRPERWRPADPAAWARYVRAVADRYRGRVRHWEVYNEVNFCPPAVPASFSGSTADYLELQRIAYRELKAADPANRVLTSGFSTSANKSMPLDALRDGLAEACDIFNVHGYSGVEGAAGWVEEWHRRRPGGEVWQSEQMWFQIEDDARRWWLTAALPVRFAAAGYARFITMGTRDVFFDRATFSPTRDQWVMAVLTSQLRPCGPCAGRATGAGADRLDLCHRFPRSDGTWLTVMGSERGAMRVVLASPPAQAVDLAGRPLRWTAGPAGTELAIPDLAYVVSPFPPEVRSAEPAGQAPLVFNGGFELVDGDIAMAGTAAGTPRGFALGGGADDPAGGVRLSTRRRSGAFAMELETADKGGAEIRQTLKVPVSGTYRLSGWFTSGGGPIERLVSVSEAASGQLIAKQADGGAVVDGWQQVTLEAPLKGGGTVVAAWGIHGTGTACLDDVALVPVPAPSATGGR
ncbi:MAG: hypothetical protein L6R48_03805 [Planctomycetes bacterium]|nr:hypothetical protein [Planctomycetota bacterium]